MNRICWRRWRLEPYRRFRSKSMLTSIWHYPVKVLNKLRRRFDACHQQMVAGAGAGDVQQVPLGVVDIFQIGIVGDRLDALLQGNDSSSQAMTATARNSSPCQGASCRSKACRSSSRLVRSVPPTDTPPCFDGTPRAAQLRRRADEHADLVRLHAVSRPLGDPLPDRLGLLLPRSRECQWPAPGR